MKARLAGRWGLLLISMTLVAVLAGCKGGPTPAPSPAADETPAATTTPATAVPTVSAPAAQAGAAKPDPLQMLRTTAQTMSAVTSWRSQMDMMITLQTPAALASTPVSGDATGGQQSSFLMNSDVSFVTGQGLTMDAKMRSAQAADVKFSMVVAGEDVFIRLGDEGWVLLDAVTAQQATSEGMLGRQSQPGLPFVSGAIPWEAFKVEDLGEERVDGVAVRRIAYDFDLPSVWGLMTLADKQKLATLYLPDELAPANIEDLGTMMDVDKVEVWIDGSGFNRRTIMEMTINRVGAVQGTMAVWIDTRMSRFNETMSIDRPSEYQKLEDVAKAEAAARG